MAWPTDRTGRLTVRRADLGLVVLFLVSSVVTQVVPGVDVGMFERGTEQPAGPLLVLAVLGETLPLLFRRQAPGLVLVVVGGALAARTAAALPPVAADFAVFVAVYSAGLYARGRQWLPVWLYALHPVALLVLPATRAGATVGAVAEYWLVMVVLPLVSGVGVRIRGVTPGDPAPAAGPVPPPPPGPPALTPREREVLALVAEGLSNPEIAARLVLSPETVKTHVRRIIGKLGVRDRTQAALRAAETGLLPPAS